MMSAPKLLINILVTVINIQPRSGGVAVGVATAAVTRSSLIKRLRTSEHTGLLHCAPVEQSSCVRGAEYVGGAHPVAVGVLRVHHHLGGLGLVDDGLLISLGLRDGVRIGLTRGVRLGAGLSSRAGAV